MEQTGPYWIEFNHANLTEDTEAWKISIEDSNGDAFMEFSSNMKHENTSSPIVGLCAGTYMICVESYYSFIDAEYQLNLMTADIPNYEGEPNQEILTAQPFMEIQDNSAATYLGNLAFENDEDYYSIQVPDAGVLALKFEHENLTEDADGWHITLKDKNSEILSEFNSNWQTISTLSPNLGIEAGTYYIEICTADYHNDSTYALTAAFHKSDLWETEFNNQISQADLLQEGIYKYGCLLPNDKADYYRFECKETGYYPLIFEHKNLTEDREGWKIDVLDKNSNSISPKDIYSNWNCTQEFVRVKMKKDEIYYILIEPIDNIAEDYQIKLGE